MEAEPECSICQEMRNKQVATSLCVVLSEKDDLTEVAQQGTSKKKKKELRQEKTNTFLQYINALLNEGGGLLCLHVKDPYMLGMFDGSVNPGMVTLVPDDTLFHDNFERHFKGKQHVIFRVKPRQRSLSSVSFETKISLDKGVENPSHGQMRQFLKSLQNDEEGQPSETRREEYEFEFDKAVKVRTTTELGNNTQQEEIIFQENATIQAKQISNTFGLCNPEALKLDSASSLARLFFDEKHQSTYLPRYITAFAKQTCGGSIFLGVREGKKEEPLWTPVGDMEKNALLTLKKPEFHLWRNSHGVYLVSKESQVDKKTTVDSGQFLCQGVALNENGQSEFCKEIQRLVEEKMYWHPAKLCGQDAQPQASQEAQDTQPQASQPPPAPHQQRVSVEFHPVLNSTRNLVVIEIKVPYYPGVAFMDKDGPKAYHFPKREKDGSVLPERMSREMWFRKFQPQLSNIATQT